MSVTCFNKKNVEFIIKNLYEPLELNKESQLDKYEEKIVDDLSDELEQIFKDYKCPFDKKGFAHLVKILHKDSAIIGGDGELVEHEGKKQGFTKYDLFALLGFLTSILLLFLAYRQLNTLLQSTVETNVVELGNEIKNKFIDAQNKLKGEELTFLTYIFKVFSNFGCGVVEGSTKKIIEIINKIIMESAGKGIGEIANVCYKGNGKKGALDFAHGMINILLDKNAIAECGIEMVGINAKQMLHDKGVVIEKLVLMARINSKEISSLMLYGSRIGYASIGYFTYRVRQLRAMRLENRTTGLSIENGTRSGPRIEEIEGGRKKSKKSKKTKKSHKSKKQRKTRNR
jgi:hypothetical protein